MHATLDGNMGSEEIRGMRSPSRHLICSPAAARLLDSGMECDTFSRAVRCFLP
jgi:hypothetical protein